MATTDSAERRIHGLTVRIDRTICVGFGDCINAAPNVFRLDDDSVAEFQDPLGELSREQLLEACRACPVDAIVVLDEEGRQLVP